MCINQVPRQPYNLYKKPFHGQGKGEFSEAEEASQLSSDKNVSDEQ